MPYCHLPHITLHYEVYGSGMPLLFLHGLGSSGKDWDNQVEHFAEDFQVYTLDLRGHGKSETPAGPYSLPLMAADVAGFIREVGIQPVHVTGLSMGGMIALQLSLDYPELVRTVAAVNCGVDYRLNSAGRWAIYLTRFLVVRLLGPKALGIYLSRRLLPDPDHAELRKEFIRRYSRNSTQTLLRCINAIAGWTIRHRLHEISHPTLIVAAEHDYSSIAEKLSWVPQIPRARFTVIPQTHHAVPVEKPWDFNTHLASFLEYYEDRIAPSSEGVMADNHTTG